MKTLLRIYLFLVLATTVHSTPAATSLPRGEPESQGVSSAALSDFVSALDQIDAMNSVMVLRHGKVIAEGWWAPYDAAHNHILYSLSKSFTSTAVGMAVAESKLSIDDEVLKFFPDDAPTNITANLKAMRVRDLLMMSTGHQDEPSPAADVISPKSFLAQPVPHLPGTHFKYNTAATFMQSAIVQKVTGQTVLDFLRPRLLEPLGIEHPVWDTNFQGISLGGYGLRVRTEDIAKFGQLYLQNGRWNGKQLIPADWVAMATAKQTSNGSNPKSDWNQGYGFQFWRCRHNAYRGDGAFGQYCLVLPQQDSVIAITSGLKDMQAVLNLVWEKLLPALGSARLKADAASHSKLTQKLASLTVHPAEGAASSPLAAKFFGRKFLFSTNDQKLEAVTLTSSNSGRDLTLILQTGGTTREFTSGYREWKKGRGSFGAYTDAPAAASCAHT
jgi:CubicO group peptidase (beta-lactamase class C family)